MDFNDKAVRVISNYKSVIAREFALAIFNVDISKCKTAEEVRDLIFSCKRANRRSAITEDIGDDDTAEVRVTWSRDVDYVINATRREYYSYAVEIDRDAFEEMSTSGECAYADIANHFDFDEASDYDDLGDWDVDWNSACRNENGEDEIDEYSVELEEI